MAISTPFTRLVGCQTPIQSAGMGTASPALAFAVARAGALGMLSGTLVPPPQLDAMLSSGVEADPGCIGINFLIPFLEDPAVIDIAGGRVRVVEFFYGEPEARLVERVHRAGALAAWQIGSVREARAAVDTGCDFIIAQGMEAGGHVRGQLALLPLLDGVLEAVSVPVVAAGGIATSRSVVTALASGATGVRLGTRFVATPESGYHPDYIQALIEAEAEDAVYTDRFSVMWDAPHRVLRASLEAAEAFQGEVVGRAELNGRMIDIPRLSVFGPIASATGAIEAMAHYAGQSVGAVRSCQPAADIVRELSEGAERLLRARAAEFAGMLTG
jgi:NAD(P)H-dependent flavin oxidoreductase YrpB (nitropropane dioxygenase family)